ncbi:hypothetical protein [Hymenobacter radiodurans]|uniref:hypothetical protein n=1 Tax=Hymenobacter radiodurans TaxID=2496028 RepID=UPI0014047139|nr:hypothetical protein [Hymenobacter radiodurans]
MENPNLKVLLLGWDETTQASNSGQPESLPLLQALASNTTLTAILPHLPTGQPSNARITSLDTLTLADLDELQPARVVGAWESPAAPYIGATQNQADGADSSQTTLNETGYIQQKSPQTFFWPMSRQWKLRSPVPMRPTTLTIPAII